MNKQEAMEKYGEAQVMEWRRGFLNAPPPLIPYQNEMKIVLRARLPVSGSESLKNSQIRVLSFWNECILPSNKAKSIHSYIRPRQQLESLNKTFRRYIR